MGTGVIVDDSAMFSVGKERWARIQRRITVHVMSLALVLYVYTRILFSMSMSRRDHRVVGLQMCTYDTSFSKSAVCACTVQLKHAYSWNMLLEREKMRAN